MIIKYIFGGDNMANKTKKNITIYAIGKLDLIFKLELIKEDFENPPENLNNINSIKNLEFLINNLLINEISLIKNGAYSLNIILEYKNKKNN